MGALGWAPITVGDAGLVQLCITFLDEIFATFYEESFFLKKSITFFLSSFRATLASYVRVGGE